MVTPKVSVTGLNNVVNDLNLLTKNVRNLPQPHLEKLADVLKTDIEERFETAGRGTWEPNRITTLRRKSGNRPLIDTGVMRGSVQISIEPNEVKASVPYAGINRNRSIPIRHQLGRGVPQRKIVDANSIELRNSILKVVNDVIKKMALKL